MELIRVRSAGAPAQVQTAPGDGPYELGVLGVAMHPKVIDGAAHTVVQVMLDDDRPGFDSALLDDPMTAEVRTPAGDVVSRELFDHDEFRRRLAAEQADGGNELRGVVLRTQGQLPPPYLRLAFLPVAVADTEGCDLVVARHGRDELLAAVDAARDDGGLSEHDHRNLRTAIDQRHPA
ncbi:MAG: hypothetical protein S0880_30245 [Actinomycetota bacterium]|nr:hypothetical protein [Actinomycetota bacterium]